MLGVADYGYQVDHIELFPGNETYTLTLRKIDVDNGNSGNSSKYHRLDYGDAVRVFAMEPNIISPLACRSVNGSIRRIEDDRIVLDIYRGRPHQLQGFPIMLLKTDVDLTKRELEGIDFVHRSASRIQRDIAFVLLGEHRFDHNAPT